MSTKKERLLEIADSAIGLEYAEGNEVADIARIVAGLVGEGDERVEWRCENCGEAYQELGGSWRHGLQGPEHRCDGLHAQAGHMAAKYVGPDPTACAIGRLQDDVRRKFRLISAMEKQRDGLRQALEVANESADAYKKERDEAQTRLKRWIECAKQACEKRVITPGVTPSPGFLIELATLCDTLECCRDEAVAARERAEEALETVELSRGIKALRDNLAEAGRLLRMGLPSWDDEGPGHKEITDFLASLAPCSGAEGEECERCGGKGYTRNDHQCRVCPDCNKGGKIIIEDDEPAPPPPEGEVCKHERCVLDKDGHRCEDCGADLPVHPIMANAFSKLAPAPPAKSAPISQSLASEPAHTEEAIRHALAEVLCGNVTEDWSSSRIIGAVLTKLVEEPAPQQGGGENHHESCDSLGVGPELEPSTKPCNCGVSVPGRPVADPPPPEGEPTPFYLDGRLSHFSADGEVFFRDGEFGPAHIERVREAMREAGVYDGTWEKIRASLAPSSGAEGEGEGPDLQISEGAVSGMAALVNALADQYPELAELDEEPAPPAKSAPISQSLASEGKDACEHCGSGATSYPNGCPGCGAPVCCQRCCDEANAKPAPPPPDEKPDVCDAIRDAARCAGLGEKGIESILRELKHPRTLSSSLADLVGSPTFTPAHLERVREVVLDAYGGWDGTVLEDFLAAVCAALAQPQEQEQDHE